jgi:hypothetical protein
LVVWLFGVQQNFCCGPMLIDLKIKSQAEKRENQRNLENIQREYQGAPNNGGPEILNSVEEIEKLDKVARRTFGLSANLTSADLTDAVPVWWKPTSPTPRLPAVALTELLPGT